jgi:hypothetical protein
MNPVLPSDWGREERNDTGTSVSTGTTYSNPFQLASENGKIYNFARYLNYNPNVFTSTNGGATWSPPTIVVQTGKGAIRPYVKYCSDYDHRIDFFYTDGHPDKITTSLYHLYYQSNGFYKTDGSFLKSYANLPILHDSGERGAVVYQYNTAAQANPNEWIPSGRAWGWEIAYQTNGDPACVFQVKASNVTGSAWSDARIYYYYARWTGTNWQKRFIAQGGRPLYDGQPNYGGGMCLDPADPNTVYISTDAVNPFDLTTTTQVPLAAHFEIWKGETTDGGLTFNWQAVTAGSSVDNLRPYIPRRFGGEKCVLWLRGAYNSYLSFATSIVGLFTSKIATNTESGGNLKFTYVDATCGVGGDTALASGATFSPPLNGGTRADNNWEQRTVFGSSGNIFEAGGAVAENAPELCTTITNLVPGANYAVRVLFWDANGSTANWCIRAGFRSAPGLNPLFSASDASVKLGATAAPLASTLKYAVAPTLFAESSRVLLAGSIGTKTADGSGAIQVFIDDKPSNIGSNNRTWYDGVAWAAISASPAPSLSFAAAGNSVSLSWPASHLGWILQEQTNSPNSGIGSNWIDLFETEGVISTNFLVDPKVSAKFFRLRHP